MESFWKLQSEKEYLLRGKYYASYNIQILLLKFYYPWAISENS